MTRYGSADEIVDPPPRWNSEYPALAQGLTTAPAGLATAMALVRDFWKQSIVCDNEGEL